MVENSHYPRLAFRTLETGSRTYDQESTPDTHQKGSPNGRKDEATAQGMQHERGTVTFDVPQAHDEIVVEVTG